MIDAAVKTQLHRTLRDMRQVLVWKLDGLSDYDIRRPLTSTGTNLLGLVKHNAIWEARYFGEVFERPFPGSLTRWDDPAALFTDHWAAEYETRSGLVEFYRRVWRHADSTIEALDLDARGYVPWWQQDVTLVNIMIHCLSDTTRHAGHADILREGLDGAVGFDAETLPLHGLDRSFWEERNALIESAAQAAEPERGRRPEGTDS